MGIQILLIVFFHFTEDCKEYNVRYSGIVYWFYNYVKSSGVDIFLLVSGLGLYYSWKKRAELKSFYQRRFVKILIPYFLVAVPAWIWLDLIEEHNGLVKMFSDLFFLHSLLEKINGSGIYYYVVFVTLFFHIYSM